jgi:hypothetical protein
LVGCSIGISADLGPKSETSVGEGKAHQIAQPEFGANGERVAGCLQGIFVVTVFVGLSWIAGDLLR